MSKVAVGYPYAEVEIATETGNLTIYQKQQLNSEMDFDILSIETSRDVGSDDCATFQISLPYRDGWYKQIGANDFLKITLGRGQTKGLVFFGLVDNIYKSWSFSNLKPIRTINITGRGFNKAVVEFAIGAIPELSIRSDLQGFFSTQSDFFDISSPSKIIKIVYDFYKEKGIGYNFANGESWKDIVREIYEEDSSQEETIGNVMTFYQYQGGMWEYLRELRNAPFNELFWEIYDDHPTMISRPTPFNPENWNKLPTYTVEDDKLIDENVGRTDVETYTLYSVKAESIADNLDKVFGEPIWYKPFYKKYGLKRLNVISKYIKISDTNSPTSQALREEKRENEATSTPGDVKEERKEELRQSILETGDKIAKKKQEEFITNNIMSDLQNNLLGSGENLSDRLGKSLSDVVERRTKTSRKSEAIHDEYMNSLEEEMNNNYLGYNQNVYADVISKKTIDLFNWNILNNQFENGSVVLKGDPNIKVGTRLLISYSEMEYYIENVSHSFKYNEEYTTTVQVTRGYPLGQRFKPPWNCYSRIYPEDLNIIGGFEDKAYVSNEGADANMDLKNSSRPQGAVITENMSLKERIRQFALAKEGEPYSQDKRMQSNYSDCSSFVYKRVMEALCKDWRGTNAPSTKYNQMRSPLWEEIPLSEAKPWDILWRKGHTEFLGDNGRTYGAHSHSRPAGPGLKFDPKLWQKAYRVRG